MERFEVNITVERTLADVWKAHEDVRLLERISPPYPIVSLVNPASECTLGTRFTVRLEALPGLVLTDWQVEIVRWEPPTRFVDRQVSGPFKFWEHTHQFSALNSTTTLVVDQVLFESNALIDGILIKPALEAMFQWRLRNLATALAG